jgi:hypothetical protein
MKGAVKAELRWTAILLCVVACFQAAGWSTVVAAGFPGLGIPKIKGESRFLDSGDHVHILEIRRDNAQDTVTLLLRVDDGYHINANPASEPYLIPTSLGFKNISPVRIIYPQATRFRPKFVNESLDVYQGIVSITAILPKETLANFPSLQGTLTVQACTDAICLPPADVPFFG